MFFQHSKIKLKLLLSQFLAIIPFLIIIFFLIDLWYDTRRFLLIQENMSTAKIMADYVNFYLYSGLNTSNILAADPVYTALQSSKYLDEPDKLKELLVSIKAELPALDSVSLFDPSGKLIATSLDILPDRIESSISDRDYYKKLIESKKPVFSNPVIGKFSEKYITVTASPVLIDNTIVGIFLSTINLEYLKKTMETQFARTDKNIILIDGNGEIVFQINKEIPADSQKKLLKNDSRLIKALSEKQTVIDNEILPVSNKPLIGAIASVNGGQFGWSVLSYNYALDIFGPIIKTQNFIWVLILVSLLVSLSVISYFLRKIKIVY